MKKGRRGCRGDGVVRNVLGVRGGGSSKSALGILGASSGNLGGSFRN